MYLSRLLVNPRDRAARADLADCHSMHRRLLTAFPQRPLGGVDARSQFGILYRVDESATGLISVLVQSREQPEWSSLPEGYLVSARGDLPGSTFKSIDASYSALATGISLRFRLRANPTRKIDTKSAADGIRRNGKRVELRGEDQWLGWLARKGVQHGFALQASRVRPDVPDVQATDQGKAIGKRRGTTDVERLTLAGVLFNGSLSVTDVALFRAALASGVGSGKAYGFGLLSVARIA